MANYHGHFEDSSGNILLPYVTDAVSSIETGSTSSQAYTTGTYIAFNNKICKVTTAITSGETLAIGTNLSEVSLGGELSGHLIASNGVAFTLQNYKDGVYTS